MALSLTHKISHVSGWKCVVHSYGTSAVSHHRGLCSIPGHSVLDLYCTLWHWDGIFHEYFIVAVCIILSLSHINSFVTSTVWCGSWQCCCITHTSIDTSNSCLSALMMNVSLHHKNTTLCHIWGFPSSMAKDVMLHCCVNGLWCFKGQECFHLQGPAVCMYWRRKHHDAFKSTVHSPSDTVTQLTKLEHWTLNMVSITVSTASCPNFRGK